MTHPGTQPSGMQPFGGSDGRSDGGSVRDDAPGYGGYRDVGAPRGANVAIATPADARQMLSRVQQAVHAAGVVGRDAEVQGLMQAVTANGNVLIEDRPGMGKTQLARVFSDATGLRDFKKIPFTPDLQPQAITGFFLYSQRTGQMDWHPGPILSAVVLADELNRATPKTQSALLEAMQEGKVTVDGHTFWRRQPGLVIATQNPIEQEGTFPLPEAQLDRFDLRLEAPNLPEDEEIAVLRHARSEPWQLAPDPEESHADAVLDANMIFALRRGARSSVYLGDDVAAYIVALARASRAHRRIALGLSIRGMLAVELLARTHALFAGDDTVLPEHVQAIFVAVAAHRLILTEDARGQGGSERGQQQTFAEEILATTPVAGTWRGVGVGYGPGKPAMGAGVGNGHGHGAPPPMQHWPTGSRGSVPSASAPQSGSAQQAPYYPQTAQPGDVQ